MKLRKSNLDEQQERKLLEIESRGFWLAFWFFIWVRLNILINFLYFGLRNFCNLARDFLYRPGFGPCCCCC